MWDERYKDAAYLYGTEPNDFLREAVSYLPANGELLSLAEGEGRNAVFLAEQGFRVTGVDGSRVGLDKAEQLARDRGVQIQTILSDLADFDMGEQRWDAIVSIWFHCPSELRARLHRAVIAALKPGGVFILESYTPEQLQYRTGGPSNADWLLSLSDARRELDGLEFVIAEEKVREVREGTLHGGTSAVVRIVARRPR